MNTLGLLTAVWKRPEISTMVLDYYTTLDTPGLEIVRICAVSEGERYEGWESVDVPNDPLGAKWNAGLKAFRKTDVDAVMIVGSDDLISPEYFHLIKTRLKKGTDYACLHDLYMYDAENHELSFLPSVMTGVGKVFSRRVLEEVNWTLWNDTANRRLDGSAMRAVRGLKMKNYNFRGMDGFAVIDIKTEENLWRLEGNKLVGGGREVRLRKVEKVEARPVLERYFPDQAERLLNW